jgi:hypothetical protein
MSKTAKSSEGMKASAHGTLLATVIGAVREALYETVIGAGLACA